jgi:predicted amidohydrolase
MPELDVEVLRALVIQTVIKQGEKEDNWARAEALLERAAASRPGLVVLPEAFASGVNFVILRSMAEPIPDGPTFQRLARLAARHGTHICAGILELGEAGEVFDTAVLVGRDGSLLGAYRRRFLWVGERNYIRAGGGPVVIPTEFGRVTMIVGYDLCFSQATDHALVADVDLILCPASVFRPLSHSAERLAAARAMDHHCYVLYANALGFHQFANMHYGGRSAILGDPYFLQVQAGEEYRSDLGVLAAADQEETVIAAELRIGALARARARKLPFKGDALFALASQPMRSHHAPVPA